MPAATGGQTYTQTGRPLQISTPLGKDALLLVGLNGTEGISQLFHYTINVKSPNRKDVPFDKLIGQPISVRIALPKEKSRFLHGICARVQQGESDPSFSDYSLEIVPTFWLLTKRAQSRIFQHISVPDILKKVLAGLDVQWELRGSYQPRDYCVQYRETDFNFASRLMEEEGIYYFFKYGEGSHTMIVADTPASHVAVPGKNPITYKTVSHEGSQDEDFINELLKSQEHISGKFTLWDHTFELPHQHLETEKPVLDSVSVGKVNHKLKLADNSKLEIYDYPGEYAQRFDGIDRSGGEQPAELKKIFEDNARTVNLRMQAAAATALSIRGMGTARQLTAGHKFTLQTLATDNAATPIKADGEYVLTTVSHSAFVPANYRSGDTDQFRHEVRFVAIPSALPFRPTRSSAKPVVPGTQTAQVVGPPGEEIFTDKYGRVKVQFHWDREGKRNADSSCWVRVAHLSAGRAWGMVSIPRIGQEVVVDFLEGDPDQPIVIGCVYNADQMPMYKLPDEKTKSYIRTNSSPGGVGYNAIRFEDKAGKEQIYLHAQKDMDARIRNDSMERVGKDRHLRVGFYLPSDHTGDASGESKKGNQFEEVAIDQHLKVHRHQETHIGGDVKLLIGGIDGDGNQDIHVKKKKHELIDDTSDLHVKKAVTELYDDTYDQHVKKAVTKTFDDTFDFTVDKAVTTTYNATLDEHVAQAVTQSFDATLDQTVGSNRTESVGGNYECTVSGNQNVEVGSSVSLTVGQNYQQKAGTKHAVQAGSEIHLQAGSTLVLEAATITLKAGGGFITISPAGVAIQGTLVLINSGGAAVPGTGSSPSKPKKPKAAKPPRKAKDAKDAKDAAPIKPKDADLSKTGSKSN